MDRYKKNNIIIVVVVSFFLLLVSGVIYYFYFKDYGEYNKAPIEKESLYVDVTDESIVNEILDVIKVNNLKDVAAFEKDIDNINILEPIEKINIAYNAIKNNDKYDVEIDVLTLDEYFNNTFKTTIYWDKSDIYCSNGEVLYKFDISSNKYFYNIEHNCENHNEVNAVYTNVLSLKKKSNTYVVTVNYVWNNSLQPDVLYSSYKDALNEENMLLVIPSEDGNVTMETIDNVVSSSYNEIKDKLHKYKYVFEKKEDKYLLVSVEYE